MIPSILEYCKHIWSIGCIIVLNTSKRAYGSHPSGLCDLQHVRFYGLPTGFLAVCPSPSVGTHIYVVQFLRVHMVVVMQLGYVLHYLCYLVCLVAVAVRYSRYWALYSRSLMPMNVPTCAMMAIIVVGLVERLLLVHWYTVNFIFWLTY